LKEEKLTGRMHAFLYHPILVSVVELDLEVTGLSPVQVIKFNEE
jgi:hypothetical protein